MSDDNLFLFLDSCQMTNSIVKTKKLRKVIIAHEKYFNDSETSMAKSILEWLDYGVLCVDTENFFDHLRSRDLKSHKVQARFGLTIFEMAGCSYRKVTNNKIKNT